MILSARALNRATLARQDLLHRADRTPLDTVRHLVGMQAQIPRNPYLGLWSRLHAFDPDDLARLLLSRDVVRIVVMRATIHLVTADDCLLLRPLMQPVLDKELARHPEFGPALRGVDLDPVLAFARPLLAERARTGTELRAAMAEPFPDLHPGALAYACRNLLAFVQVPPRGLWDDTGQVASTTAESWLGRPLVAVTEPDLDEVVVRYLAAFGPATTADVATWSRLTGLRPVLDRLRPRLQRFRDERGRELFDLPDAPRPDPDTPAPPRFLPEYDNVLLSHDDRTRVISEEHRQRLFASTGPVQGTVLHDGFVCGVWRVQGGTLVVDTVEQLSESATTAVADEGAALLRFLVPDAAAAHDVRIAGMP